MGYIWAVLAAIQPAFATVTDAVGPGASDALMKAPGVPGRPRAGGARRRRPAATTALGHRSARCHPARPGRHRRVGVVGPVRVDLRAVRAGRGDRRCLGRRNGLAAVLIAVSLAPSRRPSRCSSRSPRGSGRPVRRWRRGGLECARPGLGLATLVVLWLPFTPDGGPAPTSATSTTTRTRSSTSSRCGPGTPGGWSRRPRPEASSSPTTSRSSGRSPSAHVGYVVTGLLSVVVIAWRSSVTRAADPRARRRRRRCSCSSAR